jgi:hypothetical protein
MEETQLFGKLFDTIPLYNEQHLDVLLETMDKQSSISILTHAVKYAYSQGIYSLGECEVISKSIRISNKEEKKED